MRGLIAGLMQGAGKDIDLPQRQADSAPKEFCASESVPASVPETHPALTSVYPMLDGPAAPPPPRSSLDLAADEKYYDAMGKSCLRHGARRCDACASITAPAPSSSVTVTATPMPDLVVPHLGFGTVVTPEPPSRLVRAAREFSEARSEVKRLQEIVRDCQSRLPRAIQDQEVAHTALKKIMEDQ